MRWSFGVGVMVVAAMGATLCGCERASTTARARTSDEGASSSSGGTPGYASRDAGASDTRGGYDRTTSGSSDRSYGDEGGRRAREPVPDFHGEPMWSDNRRYSAQENATYHCGKSGPDIGAKGLDDCLTKVHAFIDHPSADVQTLTRANGDRLMYDPKANLFVVARKDGAPRTFFRPRTGAAYWVEQKTQVASGDDGYRRRSASRSGSDEGAGT